MNLPAPFRGTRAAFVFLTRIPVGGFPYSEDDWAWSSAHFPLVGLVVGAALGLLDSALMPLGALAAALLTIGASMLVTGGFHEDGLADTSDALGGAYEREKILAILKDSRIGTYGGAALVLTITVRAALIARLGEGAVWGIPLVWCGARAAAVALMAALPYATADDAAKSRLVTRGRLPQAIVAVAWLVVACIALVALGRLDASRAGALVLAMAVVAIVTGWRYARRLGGVTGDFLGATEQLGEIAGFAVLAWAFE
jgi:adenosylcobinamide-GDP ribazoletransferase